MSKFTNDGLTQSGTGCFEGGMVTSVLSQSGPFLRTEVTEDRSGCRPFKLYPYDNNGRHRG